MATAAATLEEIAGAFLRELDGLADAMAARIGDEVPEFGLEAAPELHEVLRRSCRANIDAGLRGLMRERRVPGEIPADARDLAAMSARLDVPLGATLRSYRIGHAVMWERWLAAVEARRPPAEARTALLGDASRYMFQYTDRLSTYVAELYGAERERFLRGREQRRTQRVRDVLDGAEVDAAQALAVLDYDLRMEHVGAVVSGPEPDAALAALASALDAPHRLLVALAGEVAWAWAGRTRPVHRTPAALDLPRGRRSRSATPARESTASAARIARRATPIRSRSCAARRWSATTTSRSRRSSRATTPAPAPSPSTSCAGSTAATPGPCACATRSRRGSPPARTPRRPPRCSASTSTPCTTG